MARVNPAARVVQEVPVPDGGTIDQAVRARADAEVPVDEKARPAQRDPGQDVQAEAATSPPSGKGPKTNFRRILLLIGPVVVLIGGIYFYLSGGRYVSTDNAYVKMDKLSVTTDVSGIVTDIPVQDDQRVPAGQVLFRLDAEPYRIALAGADAQLGTVRTEIANLQATYRQNLAQIEQAKSDLAYFQANYNRQSDLAKRSVVSQASFDQARRDQQGATQRLVAAQQQAEAILAQLGGNAEGKVDDHPRVKQAQAQIDKARRDLTRTVVRAPFAGIVTNVSALQIGAYLQLGQPAFSLVGVDRVWVDASPKETDLTFLKPGDVATIEIDTYPHRVWRARVASVSPASGSEFSVLPPQNASGNWVKVVQRIPVRLRLELPDGAPPLRAGMSATVQIDTGHKRTLADLFRTLGAWVGL